MLSSSAKKVISSDDHHACLRDRRGLSNLNLALNGNRVKGVGTTINSNTSQKIKVDGKENRSIQSIECLKSNIDPNIKVTPSAPSSKASASDSLSTLALDTPKSSNSSVDALFKAEFHRSNRAGSSTVAGVVVDENSDPLYFWRE